MSIPFIDLKSQYQRLQGEIQAAIGTVLDSGQYILGPANQQVEADLATFTGSAHCLGVSSGTDSLLIALMALGVGPGDEVITVPYTWISTAEVVALLGARTVFVDIREDTFNMDTEQLEAAITERTKAIIPVGIYGQCADMAAVNAIADRHRLPVIEDGAQSFGATQNGRRSCALSTVGSTSFFPTKPLGCYGDGGALFSDDGELMEKMRWIHVHGQSRKHYHPVIGINGRLDSIQAAILVQRLKHFPEDIRRRQAVAARYDAALAALADSPLKLRTPIVAVGNTSVYAQYTVLVEDRDALQARLQEAGVPSVAYYCVPLHHQPCFADLGYREGDFPVTEDIARRGLSLPMSPDLKEADQERVIAALRAAG